MPNKLSTKCTFAIQGLFAFFRRPLTVILSEEIISQFVRLPFISNLTFPSILLS